MPADRVSLWWSVTIPAEAAKSAGPTVEFAPTDRIAFPVDLAGGGARIVSLGRRPIPLKKGVVVRVATPAERRPLEVH